MKCRINRKGPAAIPDVRVFVSRARYIVRIIWNGVLTDCAAELTPAGMTPGGVKPETSFYSGIPCASCAKLRAGSLLPQW